MTEQCRRTSPGAGLMDGSGWVHKNGDPRIPDPHHTGKGKPEWVCYGCDVEIRYVGLARARETWDNMGAGRSGESNRLPHDTRSSATTRGTGVVASRS